MKHDNETGRDESGESLHYVLSAEELAEDDRVIVDINGIEVVVANVDGAFLAFSNYCPHQGGPLGEGRISGKVTLPDDGGSMSDMVLDCETPTVSCPWHGWCFEAESGEHVSKPDHPIPTYEVVERDGDLYVAID